MLPCTQKAKFPFSEYQGTDIAACSGNIYKKPVLTVRHLEGGGSAAILCVRQGSHIDLYTEQELRLPERCFQPQRNRFLDTLKPNQQAFKHNGRGCDSMLSDFLLHLLHLQTP